ncbi:MAG TPA: hypothetical protein VKW08_00450 [Xanthobacteraceae bacterium]|nr:hypothetical protein [Xanthobacteraceae bacterium]
MKYTKSIGGAWAKSTDITSGTKAKIMSETTHTESQFKDKNGAPKFQDVAKVRFEGKEEALNVNLNRATIYGLIDAFGEESKDWIGKVLTVHTEKVVVAGKRVTALYLIPEGFEVRENSEGYIEVVRTGQPVSEQPVDDGPNPDDIPF